MTWTPLSDRLAQLPLILAGPILRRVEPDAVTVWLALKHPGTVTLQVHETRADSIMLQAVLSGSRTTVALGQFLHVVAVTASSKASEKLQPGQVYAYDLMVQTDAAESPIPLQQALHSLAFPAVPISYFNHGLPTFSLPPARLSSLKIVHGSCRKPHGGEADTLPILDELIEQNAESADDRPHQLFLTGDQVYGDDVADALLWQLTDASETLLGWSEALPTASYAGVDLTASRLRAGHRSVVAEEWAGFTAGLHGKPECDRSHLFSLGEYAAIYLFVWSPVLWTTLPTVAEINGTAAQAKYWDKEAGPLEEFVYTLWKVRRALANVSTYMIFDDHDISDDWNLNQAWCLQVLGKPMGQRVVQNGLLAYALFQAWGNTPDQFEPGQVGEKLLQATADWVASGGTNLAAGKTIAQCLGLPPQNPVTGLPELRLDGEVWVLAPASGTSSTEDCQSLQWHYIVRGSCHEVVVLDTRTWRGYPAGEASPQAPPMLLSPSAFDLQIRWPLTQTDRPQTPGTDSRIVATFVVAPTNLISLRLIDWIQHWNLQQGTTFKNDVGDAWNINKVAFAKLLSVLFECRDCIIILSGDIHYGSAVRLEYWSHDDLQTDPHANIASQMLIQLTSSAIKNSEAKTRIVHTKLKSLLPELDQDWVGWVQPKGSSEKPQGSRRPPRSGDKVIRRSAVWGWFTQSAPPDWRYRVHWLDRQPAQVFRRGVQWLKPAARPKRWIDRFLTQFNRLWQNRWLQEGKEVVGRNNIGVVCFPEQDQLHPHEVAQDLYWYPTWKRDRVVFSRFSASLAPESND
ncbi:PhoD-like phosphatase [Phormidium tenue FACHB-886]|nr:PhoD-like phosphatase [Phormidium tenue FACHB-886]